MVTGYTFSGRSINPLNRRPRVQQTTFINIFYCFSEKIRLDVSSESFARQRIHMKNQALEIKVKN